MKYKIVNVKIDNIKYIDCGGYGTLAAFSIGKLLYCKFNGNNKVSEVTQHFARLDIPTANGGCLKKHLKTQQ